jgi:hypothetical protein
VARDILTDLARLGAQARIQQLNSELNEIFRRFPDLRGGRAARPRAANGTSEAPAAPRRRKKRTAAQRKAASLRMKKYWADRRKAAKS